MSEIDLDNIVIQLDLPRLGELIAAVADAFAKIREIDPPDFEGEEMRQLAGAGWDHVCFMADRADFARSVKGDLEKITAPEPERRGLFGFGETPIDQPVNFDPPV